MSARRICQQGLTLIEMMIAVLISMVLSIVVMMVLSTFEGSRRTVGSGSDLDQSGAIAMFQLDRWIRSAGSGLGQASSFAYGCRVFAASGGKQILPATGALPAPFASASPKVSGEFRLAPIVILADATTPGVSGKTSDALVVMSTGNDAAQAPAPLTAPPTASAFPVANLSEFSVQDLLLLADKQPASGGGPADCMVTQAGTSFAASKVSLPLGTSATYYAATIGSASLASFTSDSMVFDLGSATANGTAQPPSFQIIGVGDNNTLFSYDLMGLGGSTSQAQAEGVFELHAVYGINSTGATNNVIDKWVDAGSTSTYSTNALTDGSAGSLKLIKNIRAVRIALILRTSLPEKTKPTTSTTLSYFTDLTSPWGLNKTRTLSSAEQYYRYRVVESTIPVRNNNF